MVALEVEPEAVLEVVLAVAEPEAGLEVEPEAVLAVAEPEAVK